MVAWVDAGRVDLDCSVDGAWTTRCCNYPRSIREAGTTEQEAAFRSNGGSGMTTSGPGTRPISMGRFLRPTGVAAGEGCRSVIQGPSPPSPPILDGNSPYSGAYGKSCRQILHSKWLRMQIRHNKGVRLRKHADKQKQNKSRSFDSLRSLRRSIQIHCASGGVNWMQTG